MTWFRVDDKLHEHRKPRRAGIAAMGLFALAGSWSADNLSDGFVPEHVIDRWSDKEHDARELAARLVKAGYWTRGRRHGDKGWLFNNWGEYQPTKAEVLRAQQKKIAAGKAGGIASGVSRRRTDAEASASSKREAQQDAWLNPSPALPGLPPNPPQAGGHQSRCQRHKARPKKGCADCQLPPIERPDATPLHLLCDEHAIDRRSCVWCRKSGAAS